MCPRGDLNTETGAIFPGSGKSCNKSNTRRADEPGHSAACSLSGPLPGSYVAIWQVRACAPAPLAAARLGYPAAGLREQTGLPSMMSLGRTREAPFCSRVSSPVQAAVACRVGSPGG
jgi:hypothetical protein